MEIQLVSFFEINSYIGHSQYDSDPSFMQIITYKFFISILKIIIK